MQLEIAGSHASRRVKERYKKKTRLSRPDSRRRFVSERAVSDLKVAVLYHRDNE